MTEQRVGDLVEHLYDNLRTLSNVLVEFCVSGVIGTLIFLLQAYSRVSVQSDDPTSRGEMGEINGIIRDFFCLRSSEARTPPE